MGEIMTFEHVGHILGVSPLAVDRWVKFYNLPSEPCGVLEVVDWEDVTALVNFYPELLTDEQRFFIWGTPGGELKLCKGNPD